MEQNIHNQKNKILQDKNEIEKKIDEILKKQKNDHTFNSMTCLRIVEQLEIVQPMLEKVDQSIMDVNDETLGDFYRIFRNLFKQFQKEVKETSDQMNDGTFGTDNKISKQKMKQIKDLIYNLKDELNNINNKMKTPCKKCLIWLDYNVYSSENKRYLKSFQELCNGAIEEILTFSKDEEFQNYVKQNLNQKLLYIIMSGSSAGGFSKQTDGRNLEWLKNIKKQKISQEFIQGVFIFTSAERQEEFQKIASSEQGFVYLATSIPNQMFAAIQNLIFPKDCLRVIPLVQLCQYLDQGLRQEFLLLKNEEEDQLDYLKFQLTDFHPNKPYKLQCNFQFFELQDIRQDLDNQNLKQRLEKAKTIAKNYKIQIPDSFIDPQGIYQDLLECFEIQNPTNHSIAIKILNLYTRENSKFYKFLNTLLSVLNQDMLVIFWDLIQCFRAALVIYDDSQFSKIKKPIKQNDQNIVLNQSEQKEKVTLYRGVPIPLNIFESLYKPNEMICMCGFSSFSLNPNVARNFSKMGGITDVRVIFQLDFEYGSKQYQMRPKCLQGISKYETEVEYLLNCGSVFKIKSVTKIKDNEQVVEITL
ncbi:hypothetical protein ABPG74_020562 [Tetrahymena malaccensis]